MDIFIVNQNPDSKYNDEVGKRYDYPTSIANGKQIKIGDNFSSTHLQTNWLYLSE